MSTTEVTLSTTGIVLPYVEQLPWSELEKINTAEGKCFVVRDGEAQAVHVFSEATNRECSLFPTSGAPSMLIAGFVMHRIKDILPWEHAQSMVAAISPMTGQVLDTTTGLGYTAILAAHTAESVTAIELDPAVQELCRFNPWSQELFTNPKITQMMGDATDVVLDMESESFSRILHDPPAFSLSGDLYSGKFYGELYRLLKRGGRLFHYVGDPNSKASGGVTRGVLKRLQEAGFKKVIRHAEAYGVVAYK
jgi:predicted methyltransferase